MNDYKEYWRTLLIGLIFLQYTPIYSLPAPVEMKARVVKTILPRPRPHWVGNGFNVFPVFADKAFEQEVSPFLMFDYAAPKEFPPTSKQLGVGEHPHRGMETISVAFQGEVEHRDSLGNTGVIGSGDVQWMTAGRGIVHEEYHSRTFAKSGGVFEFCQIWLNLPAKDKMNPSHYQPILKDEIPQIHFDNSKGQDETCSAKNFVRVIAGDYNGTNGPAKTHSPVELYDVNISKDTSTKFKFPASFNVIVFTRNGSISVAGKQLGPQSVAIMEREGDFIDIQGIDESSSVMILAGLPLNEPIAARGPFVMNTEKELYQAMSDYQSGNFL